VVLWPLRSIFRHKTHICKLLKLCFYSHFQETIDHDHERFWVYCQKKNDETVKKTVSCCCELSALESVVELKGFPGFYHFQEQIFVTRLSPNG